MALLEMKEGTTSGAGVQSASKTAVLKRPRKVTFIFTLTIWTIYNSPTNELVCNKTLIQTSHIKTFKITPIYFDHQLIIIRELFDPS
jgi:hypothetical protein